MPLPQDYVPFPPNGIDRADGTQTDEVGNPIGTADVEGSVQLNNPNNDEFVFEELTDSPEIERAEQGTIQHRFRVDPTTGLELIKGLPRGRFLEDSAGNVTRVVSSRLNWSKPNIPILTVTAESLSFDTPPDEFSIQVIELSPALEKHPRYAFLTVQIRNLVSQCVSGSQSATQAQAEQVIRTGLPGILHPIVGPPPVVIGTDDQIINACIELLNKRRIGEDSFYLPGFQITWAQYFWAPQFMNPGGYIGDPILEGLPWFFWAVPDEEGNRSPSSDDIFHRMADINPQFYTLGPDANGKTQRDGITWLRQSDLVEYSRTWFKYTHSWIGAPYAHWDADLYSEVPSPYPLPPPLPKS